MLKIGKIELPDVYPNTANISGSWDVSVVGSTNIINAIKGAFSNKSLSLEFLYVLDKTKYLTIDDFIVALEEEIINNPSINLESDLKLFDGAKQGRCVIESYGFNKVTGSPQIVNISMTLHYKPVYTASILNPLAPPSLSSSFMNIDWDILAKIFGSSLVNIIFETTMPENIKLLKATLIKDANIAYLPSQKYNIGWFREWCDIGDVDTTLFIDPMPPNLNPTIDKPYQIYNSISKMSPTAIQDEYSIFFNTGMPEEGSTDLITYIYDANNKTIEIFNGLNKIVLHIDTLTAEISQSFGNGLFGKSINMTLVYNTSTITYTVSEPIYIGTGIKYGVEITVSFTDASNIKGEIKISTRFATSIEFTIKYGADSGTNKFYRVGGLNSTNDIERHYYTSTGASTLLTINNCTTTSTNKAIGLSYQSTYTLGESTYYQTIFYSGKISQGRGLSTSGTTMVFCTDNILANTPTYCSIMIVPKKDISDTDKIDAFGMLAYSFIPKISNS
jgi:hypothetical protein